ncbi:MAG: hypothetical protein HFE84_03730 [Lachnospiraceae bacterium]|nr:hypothetical protein [Lachnospiraceae bacterium]
MSYEQFCTTLCSTLTALTAPGITVTPKQIPKNNGVFLDALWLRREKAACSPIVYLKPLYQEYCQGKSVDALSLEILRGIRRDRPFSLTLPDLLIDLESAKEYITFRLISRTLNEPFLDGLPWFPFLDLAIVFYLQLPADSGGITSVCINKSLLELWSLTPDVLRRIAFQNTPRLLLPCLVPLEDMLRESLENGSTGQNAPSRSDFPAPVPPSLYILTNRQAAFGAACLLYDGLIKKFAGQMLSDVLILPSSIHEVLLLPRTAAISVTELRQTVKQVNETMVDRQELLSGEVYLYEQKTDRFTLCPPDSPSWHDTPETDGKMNP